MSAMDVEMGHKLHATEIILGESSTVEEVFLSDQSPGQPQALYELDVCNNTVNKPSSSNNYNLNLENNHGPNCHQVCLSYVAVIIVTCALLVICRGYIKDFLLWLESLDVTISCLMFLVVFTIVSFPVAWGYLLFMVTAGYLFGFVHGTILVIFCGAIGVCIAHLTMKNFFRNFIVNKFYNDKMTAVISVVEGEQGFKVIALTRLTPVPFGLQNGLFSLTDVSLVTYLSATVFGSLPTAIINSYIGSTLRSMEDVLTDESSQATGYLVFIVQILLTVGLLFFVVRKARVELKKAVDKGEEDLPPDVLVHNHIPVDRSKIKVERSKVNGYVYQ